MADRGGNCKLFVPNYFNPTKCQNCFKPKDQHGTGGPETATAKVPLSKKTSSLGRTVLSATTILKESILLKAVVQKDDEIPTNWETYWFTLKSTGELQQFGINEDGQIDKNNELCSVMLQEFIRMLDGKVEIGEELCFGVRTLRDTTYFKTKTKVDYENWWKEFSSFVVAPIKRTTSAASALRHGKSTTSPPGYNKPSRVQKQYSVPSSTLLSKLSSRSSRSSSISSVQSEPEHPQMESLRNQVSKLEDENSKLSKAEEQRRKLELEVNYWKEYVTNSQSQKRAGASLDIAAELSDTREKFIQAQDELNETRKKLKTNQGKILMQNKELHDMKEKLREANSIIAVHKAKIDHLSKESNEKCIEKGLVLPVPSDELFYNGTKESTGKTSSEKPLPRRSDGEGTNSSAQNIEDRFLLLKDRLKCIEKELVLKSKELEKANESRSKVAKYTRSLLQELEARLVETEKKLTNTTTELSMERERRKKLEEGPRRRMSSVASPPNPKIEADEVDAEAPPSELSDHDADTKYADYYRSRFKEAEASLFEKDKKLHQAEEKIKEIQLAMKSNTDSYKVINELQTKLSDATHKLSDRQLKIHELTRENDRLKEFEKTYTKKNKRCETLEEIVKDLEKTNSEQKRSLHQAKQELEMTKIREVVLHEQLQTFAEDSDESEDEDNSITTLGKSIDLKKKIECMVELEALAKKLEFDNEKLTARNSELETRLRNINIQSFKTLEAQKSMSEDPFNSNELDAEHYDKTIRDLQQQLSASEEKYCSEMSALKEKYFSDLSVVEKKFNNEKSELEEKAQSSLEQYEGECNELRGKLTMLQIKYSDLEEELKSKTSQKEEEKDVADGKVEKSLLCTENDSLKMKVSQLERKLKLSSEKFEDIITSLKEKGSLLGGGKQDRDSGIVITQEIKNIIDSYSKDVVEQVPSFLREVSEDVYFTPSTSISSDPEASEKYKQLCASYDAQVKDISKKLIASEEKVIQLAEELEQHLLTEDEYVSKFNALVTRIDDLQTQIMESQESLQSKADELERERKNVINLVEVTSAYIKELETSVTESKVKIQELQTRLDIKPNDRQPDEINEVNNSQQANCESSSKRQISELKTTILQLQLNISEIKAKHEEELKRALSDAEHGEYLKGQESVASEKMEEELITKIKNLEEQLEHQKEHYSKDIVILQRSFQNELKAAFNGDTGSMDMFNRTQELEIELDATRKECETKLKDLQEQFEKEKEQLKDDMAMVIQASLSAQIDGPPDSESQTELDERIVQLEQELIEMEERYQEELEMEKEAHQKEMEDTIRDMMLLRNATDRYDGDAVKTGASGSMNENLDRSGSSTKMYSSEEMECLQREYEEKLEAQLEDHDNELAQVREDMALIINSVNQGNSSETIIELQAKLKDLEFELEDVRRRYKKEKKDLEQQVNKLDSKNFFAMRRNEEMGGKIFQMQIDMEETERKHQAEIEAYQAKISALSGDSTEFDEGVHESVKLQEELKEKNRELEREIEDILQDHSEEIESITMQLQREKQEAIEEMTDKVLKLEEIIDELKTSHKIAIDQYEMLSRNINLESVTQDKEHIKELELTCERLKEEYEKEIEELVQEHKREAEKLRLFYERELGEMKKRTSSDVDASGASHMRKNSVDPTALKHSLKEQKERYENEIKQLKEQHSIEIDALKDVQERTIIDIRTQYDEKLKMSYKEGLRRHSVSERKSDATKMKELIAEKELYQSRVLELEVKYENDTNNLNDRIVKLQNVIADLKGGLQQEKGIDFSKITLDSLLENDTLLEDESQRKLKEIGEQIERYERRIEYYREKSQRENTEESHRVSELQSEIVDLHKTMKTLQEVKQREVYEKEKREKVPGSKVPQRRNTDGSTTTTPRRHTDSDAVRSNTTSLRDPKKRWSDLQERTEVISRSIAHLDGKKNPKLVTLVKSFNIQSAQRRKDEGKCGTVQARKSLWESITIEEPNVKISRLQKQSTIK